MLRALRELHLLIRGFNAEIPCRVSSMYAVRPDLHAVLGPGQDSHLRAGVVESTASGWFLCSISTRVRSSRSGLALPRLVFFLAGVVECQMGPGMLFEQAGLPILMHW